MRSTFRAALNGSWDNAAGISHSSELFLVTALSVFAPTYIAPLSQLNGPHSAAESLGVLRRALDLAIAAGPERVVVLLTMLVRGNEQTEKAAVTDVTVFG